MIDHFSSSNPFQEYVVHIEFIETNTSLIQLTPEPSKITFQIYPEMEALPPPHSMEAQYNDAGTYISISFPQLTNRALMEAAEGFSCDNLFEFTASQEYECVWIDDSHIRLSKNQISENFIQINDTLTLKPQINLKAKCTNIDNDCSNWDSSSSIRANVRAPQNPRIPTISISAPESLEPCSPFILDLSGTNGKVGRPWQVSEVIVTSTSKSTTIDTLQKLLTRYNHNDTNHLDPNLFEYGHQYNFLIKKCNFLGACATANHQLHVLDLLYSGTPSVRIFGSNQRVMMRGDWLELKASAFVASCNGSAFYEIDNILFEWSVLKDGVQRYSICLLYHQQKILQYFDCHLMHWKVILIIK